MTLAPSPSSNIYEGVWTNWQNGGRILGATLTVDPAHASILSAALALIISIAGSQLWRLFQFALHQTRATHRHENFLYHQQQVTLRNTATDLNTLWRLLRIGFAWRHQSDIRHCRQSLPLIVWTTAHLTLVVLAGLFASWLLRSGDQVLSRSPWCGTTSDSYLDTVYSDDVNTSAAVTARFDYATYRFSRYAAIQQQVDICETSVEGCGSFFTRHLSANLNVTSDSCPFESSICYPGAGSISFDTGFLSSATHLGLNAGERDRVSFRLTAQCAPLADADHVSGWQTVAATSSLPAHEAADAHYGPGVNMPRNTTFTHTKQYRECTERATIPPYILNAEWSPPGGIAAGATFDPIPELQLDDQDLSLIMLMGDILVDKPVTDPWFNAQLAVDDTNAFCLAQNRTAYTRSTPITTLGCKQQWQICNTDVPTQDGRDECTSPLSITQLRQLFIVPDELHVFYNPRQLATVSRLLVAATGSSFYYVVRALVQTNGAPLRARRLVAASLGLSLPDTQWRIEAEYWMEMLLAYMQQNCLDYNSGQFVSSTDHINVTTHTSDSTGSAYWLCQNQLIYSDTYRNFNFFALVIWVTICFIIIVLGLSIEDIIGYIRQRRLTFTGHNGKQDMWIVNSDLEMLRTISELKDSTRWTRSPFGIPLAAVGSNAGVEDLRSDDLDAEPGHGIYNKSVKRQQTMTTLALSPIGHRTKICGIHEVYKDCAGCRSFEMQSIPSEDSLVKPDQTGMTNSRADFRALNFSNEINAQTSQPYAPLLAMDVSQSADQRHDYVPIHHDPLFDLVTQHNRSAPSLSFADHFNKPPAVVISAPEDQDLSSSEFGTDTDTETRGRKKKPNSWQWSNRRTNKSGVIC